MCLKLRRENSRYQVSLCRSTSPGLCIYFHKVTLLYLGRTPLELYERYILTAVPQGLWFLHKGQNRTSGTGTYGLEKGYFMELGSYAPKVKPSTNKQM